MTLLKHWDVLMKNDMWNSKIYVAGHTGLVGSALCERMKIDQFQQVLDPKYNGTRLDLCCQKDVDSYFLINRPEYVFLIAAKVGGIQANIDSPAEFIYNNLMIQSNVIDAAFAHGVKKLLFLGSSCIYPRAAPQPMMEEYLMSGPLEPTNESYALAKIAGIKMCQSYNEQYGTNFIALMPPNLYGPGDNFTEGGHVLASLIRKFHIAKVKGYNFVEFWGTGEARREFLFVNDLVSAMIYTMNHIDATPDRTFYNVGSGIDVTIEELACLIRDIVGYKGTIVWNTEMPNGMPQKLLDSSRITKRGWYPTVSLDEGIKRTYKWFLQNGG